MIEDGEEITLNPKTAKTKVEVELRYWTGREFYYHLKADEKLNSSHNEESEAR